MGRQADFFRRVADCERLMRAETDSKWREMVKRLRDFWIALANEFALGAAPSPAVDKEIAAIQRIQSEYQAEADAKPLH